MVCRQAAAASAGTWFLTCQPGGLSGLYKGLAADLPLKVPPPRGSRSSPSVVPASPAAQVLVLAGATKVG